MERHADMESLFARDGRLLDLTIDRYLLGELCASEVAEVDEHLAAHPAERVRLTAVRQAQRAPLPALRLPQAVAAGSAPAAPSNVVPLRRSLWPVAGGLLAAAAAALLLVNPTAPQPEGPTDQFVSKGGALPALTLEVFRSDGEQTPQLHTGETVRAGDRLALRVGSEADGELLILGIDGGNNTYPCYPQGTASSAPLTAGPPAQLPAAITMDATPGMERLVALRCPAPMRFDDVSAQLLQVAAGLSADVPLPPLQEGCAQAEIRLRKAPL